MRALIAFAALAATMSSAAAENQIAFIACPIYRDTDAGPKSGCWLADDAESGQRYDVTQAPAKPDWNRAVLVEGRPAEKQTDVCGGRVLEPVRVTVLRDTPCPRTMLPAEGFPGHPFKLPSRLILPLYEKRPPFEQPFTERTFSIPFEFGSSFVGYQLGDYFADQAVAYALATGAREIRITGWAATRPWLVSGRDLREQPAVAEARAQAVATWMERLGVPRAKLKIAWKNDPAPAAFEAAEGLETPSLRRVDVVVIPGDDR